MLKLAQLLTREDPKHKSSDIDQWIRVAAKTHPGLTVEELLSGQRDSPKGYVGWFWGSGGASAALVSRICLGMQCRPTTLLMDAIGVQT